MNENYSTKKLFEKYRLDYIIILLVCAGIRIVHIDTFDLWGDEVYNFFHVNSFYFSVRKTPLYILINLIYKSFLSESFLYTYNFVPRIPALIFGMMTVMVLYDGFKRFRGTVPALIMAVLSIASYPLIIYSTESRFYSMTHFFTAGSLWFFLSILDDPSRKRIVGFTITAVLGFLTYPYLTFSIFFLYVFLFVELALIKKSGELKFFISCFLVYFFTNAVFLFMMRGSFSSSAYAPLGFSLPFFVFALKSIISYFSGNSYLLAAIAFVFPLKNIYAFIRRRSELKLVYAWWMLCFGLVLGHIFIITFLTVNAFNPRHLSFLAIPYLAAITLGMNEILKFVKQHAIGKERLFTIVFFVCLTGFALNGRDFKHYMRFGENYHAVNKTEISDNIKFVKEITGDREEFLLFYIHHGKLYDYIFYYYRSGKRIIDICEYQKILEYHKLPKFLRLGLIMRNADFEKDQQYSGGGVLEDFSMYNNKKIKIFLSKKMVEKNQIDLFVSRMKAVFLKEGREQTDC